MFLALILGQEMRWKNGIFVSNPLTSSNVLICVVSGINVGPGYLYTLKNASLVEHGCGKQVGSLHFFI